MCASIPRVARCSWMLQLAGRRRLNKGEGTLLDIDLGSGELLLHVDDVLLSLTEVVFDLKGLVGCLIKLGLFCL